MFSQHKEISSNTVTYIERSCQPPTLHPPHYSRSWMGVRIMLYSALPCVKKEEKNKYISTILFTAKSHCSHVPRFFHHTWQVCSWYIVNERVPDLLKMIHCFTSCQNFCTSLHCQVQWGKKVPLSFSHLIQISGIVLLYLFSFSGVIYVSHQPVIL